MAASWWRRVGSVVALALGLSVVAISSVAVGQESGCTIGTSGDDLLEGTNQANVICGMGGDDVIEAGNGNDIVYGGAGDDSIYGETAMMFCGAVPVTI